MLMNTLTDCDKPLLIAKFLACFVSFWIIGNIFRNTGEYLLLLRKHTYPPCDIIKVSYKWLFHVMSPLLLSGCTARLLRWCNFLNGSLQNCRDHRMRTHHNITWIFAFQKGEIFVFLLFCSSLNPKHYLQIFKIKREDLILWKM